MSASQQNILDECARVIYIIFFLGSYFFSINSLFLLQAVFLDDSETLRGAIFTRSPRVTPGHPHQTMKVKEGPMVIDVMLVGPEKPGAQKEALEDACCHNQRKIRRQTHPPQKCILHRGH